MIGSGYDQHSRFRVTNKFRVTTIIFGFELRPKFALRVRPVPRACSLYFFHGCVVIGPLLLPISFFWSWKAGFQQIGWLVLHVGRPGTEMQTASGTAWGNRIGTASETVSGSSIGGQHSAGKNTKEVVKMAPKIKKAITIEKKKEIMQKFESGVRVTDLALIYGMSKSTISTIFKRKDLYKEVSVARGVIQITKQRSTVIDEVESLLLLWINERQMAGDCLSECLICEKARAINADIVKDKPLPSEPWEIFHASKGWFQNFKARTGVHSVVRHGETASSDKKAAENYIPHFEAMTQRNGFSC
ncbi:tigger transposable element-derived protein 1-like [Rhinatrema bivittatum]|uniref:tigger transposable element-derived protein 1-like n=1 Tax=Rhinatrema bivittatum TaxID=194408 RepID=UPI001125C216|nr:tigger transposable element-derived protein 1-like [Rhinatrema bivittatum]